VAELLINGEKYGVAEIEPLREESTLLAKRNEEIIGRIQFKSGAINFPGEIEINCKNEDLEIITVLTAFYWNNFYHDAT
jgi:hypothetical protein